MQFRSATAGSVVQRLAALLSETARRVLGSPLLQRIGRTVSVFANAGTEGHPPDARRRLKILNMISYLVATTTLIYAVQLAIADAQRFWPVILANFAIIAAATSVPLLHRFNDVAGGLMLVGTEYIALQVFTWFFTTAGGGHLQYIILAAAGFVVFGLKRLRLVLGLIALAFALHLYAAFNYAPQTAFPEAEQAMMVSLYIQGAVTTFGLIAASVYYAFSLAERAKAETDQLLRNILPDRIVERLTAQPNTAIADSFDEASILFADMIGFVSLARSLGAERMVSLLNTIVSEFDALAARHGVEKIKTIGDAYMAAAGIPTPCRDHAARLVRFAMDLLASLRQVSAQHGVDLNLRIGIASGPVMAGVIGTNKFTYDVWGDTVNLASRLETLGQPGRIHVCPTCHRALASEIPFESCGEIDIKGIGRRETWLVALERPAAAPAHAVVYTDN